MQAMRAWLLESAFQWVLLLTVKYYVEERGVAALLLFSDIILGRAKASALNETHLLVATSKRATITAGLIKGPIGQSEQFDHQAFALLI